MDHVSTVEMGSVAEEEYIRAVRLCNRALQGAADEHNEAHKEVLTLVHKGIYRHHDGELVRVFGILREFIACRMLGSQERYVVGYYPLSDGFWKKKIKLHYRLLVGEESGHKKGWLMPMDDGRLRYVHLHI